jgi:hypothetical protein
MNTIEKIRDLLRTNDRAVMRAVWVLFERQTSTEQLCGQTLDDNGVGFNAFDAEFLTSLAGQVDSGWSPKQLSAGRKAVMKYAGQLVRIANGEA